jgi:hypothetical protein
VDFWPVEDVRFSDTYTADYRNEDGSLTDARFRELALEALSRSTCSMTLPARLRSTNLGLAPVR